MKKVLPLLTVAILFTGTIIGSILFLDAKIERLRDTLIYANAKERNFCKQAMAEVLSRGSIPVFGSSELYSADELAYPSALFHGGNSDFNMILIGQGGTQSLHHAINLGAMSELLPDKKAVLIVSPQWFSEDGVASRTYSSRFSERVYADFLRNGNLSHTLQSNITNRVTSLLEDDPNQLARIENYKKALLQCSLNPMAQLGQIVYDSFMDLKAEFSLCQIAREQEWYSLFWDSKVWADEIDFDALKEEAVLIGQESCTNNSFYVNDPYYDEYIAETLEDYRNSYVDEGYASSPEYQDLKFFLLTCREAEINPLIISIPMNGWWYDWIGFERAQREVYYQNIRSICTEYGVALADFSTMEYEPYFLKDVMHLGWKGWAYVDEVVYEFYKQP